MSVCLANLACLSALSTRLKAVSGSQGLMLEGTSPSLTAPGGPHWNCPDKEPQARLDTLAEAGVARIPFTTGGALLCAAYLHCSVGKASIQAGLRSGGFASWRPSGTSVVVWRMLMALLTACFSGQTALA